MHVATRSRRDLSFCAAIEAQHLRRNQGTKAMKNPQLTSVAIVEDNSDFRASLERYINQAPGHRCVCVCGTAEEALQKIPRLLPDVALMDIHLPNLSGVECTRRLKESCPSVQILILTIYED